MLVLLSLRGWRGGVSLVGEARRGLGLRCVSIRGAQEKLHVENDARISARNPAPGTLILSRASEILLAAS
jgi:hypothetical protein